MLGLDVVIDGGSPEGIFGADEGITFARLSICFNLGTPPAKMSPNCGAPCGIDGAGPPIEEL